MGLKQHETKFNMLLGESLIKTNAEWNENNVLIEIIGTLKSSKSKRVDILIADNVMPPVVIETSYTKGDADKDAISRLGERHKNTMGIIRTAIAVEIDEKYRQVTNLNRNDMFKYALHQRTGDNPIKNRRFPSSGFLEGTYVDIAKLAASTAVPKEKLEQVAKEVGMLVKAASSKLENISDSKLLKIRKTLYQRSKLTGRRTTAVLWLNALFVQRMLYNGQSSIPETTKNPDECVDAWNKIYKINWKAIFKPAIDILDELKTTNPQETSESLDLLLQAVNVIQIAKLGNEINIGAELFPILASDRKNSAAYYTQPHTAELLTELTINDEILNFKIQNNDVFEKFCVGDLACGTGTLLRFAYKQIKAYYEHGGVQKSDKFHKSAMEKGLFGVDVSPIASHLAASSLAINSKTPYSKTNIGWVSVGNDDLTGSIEYMNKDAVTNLFLEGFGISSGENESPDKNSVVIKKESMSVILGNPPYSRTRKGLSAFDIAGLSEKERIACQKKWAKLIENEDCLKTAGMAATFICIANKKIIRGGRIGFVLPRSAAHEDTWEITRNMLERQFKNIMAIVVRTGQARGKTALSADTKFEEMLLIATKKKNDDKACSPIRCVTLRDPAMRIGEAAEIAKAITNSGENGTIRLGDTEIGVSYLYESDSGSPWSMLGIEHDGLAAITDSLIRCGELCRLSGAKAKIIPMTTIGNLFEVGPTHDLIGHLTGGDQRGAFEFQKITRHRDALGKHRSLWNANHNVQNTLIVVPTHRGKVHNFDKSKIMWEKAGTLFYARGMQWTSQTITAATTEQKVMGGRAWTALFHSSNYVQKAFALWSNSIYGMIAYWAQGGRTQIGRSTLQVRAISKVKCPNFNKFHSTKLEYAAHEFDKVAKTKLLAAYKSDKDEIRIKINKIVSNMLGAKDYDHYKLTELWCSESSVRGKPTDDQILW